MATTLPDDKAILLIDDDKLLLDMYALKFKEAKFAVMTALTSEEALAHLRDKKPPGIILLDMIMPGVDGFELFEQLHGIVEGTGTCIIILSNQDDEASMQAAKALGAAGYILKANTIPSEVVREVERIAAAAQSSVSP